MTAKSILRAIFPQPRRKLRFVDVLPLIIFLVVFGGLCLYLELSEHVMFIRPWAFALLLLTPWIWWMGTAGYAGLSRARNNTSLFIRLLMVGMFVALLAEPRAVRTRDVLSVVYNVDMSDSVDRSTDKALEFVARTATTKPELDEAGLVVFGRNAAVELPPRISFPFENVINSRIDRDATNLEQSLSLSAAMLPEENRGRIVLISDGTETVGSLNRILDDLKSRHIAVDVLPIEYNYDDEVLLERFDLPRFVKIGESYEASIVLSSMKDGNGRLVVKENRDTIFEDDVSFQAGKNKYVIPIKLREPGYYEYTARIETEPGKDHLRDNNEVVNYIFVEGEGKVLLVTDPTGEAEDWKRLAAAIERGKRMVELVSAFDFPRDSLSLMPYDAIVFVNVPADAIDALQIAALHDSVKNLGVGFLMVGGENSFGPGGYHRTPVEDLLPVTMDITKKKQLPKGALVIILHTCEFPEGNTWAKRITKQAIKVLGARDEAGVIAYDYQTGEEWVFELTPAGEYESLVPKINAAQIGDMPSFTSTMEMALDGLTDPKCDAATKHMIIISDGDPPPAPPGLLQKFLNAKISISTVAIYPHTPRDVTTLRAIAEGTRGKFYFPNDPSLLPAIFIKEAKTLKRSMIQEKEFTAQVDFPDSTIKGIDALPKQYGYVLVSARDDSRRCQVVLRAPPEDEGDIDPVLAIGKYGLATTAAFTSDLTSKWGRDWMGWDKFDPFVAQLMTRISRVRKDGHLRLWTYTSGSDGVIIVEDFHPEESFLEVRARISGPRNQVETIPVRQVGPRRYQATLPLWGKGRYQVMAVGVAGDRTDTSHGGFIVPYSPEYLRFRSNHIVLDEIAEATGGEKLNGVTTAETIYGRREPKQSSWPVFDWLLVALACLVPLDVGFRRVQLDWYVIKSWFGLDKRSTESTKTMGTLLERKQQVGSQFDRQKTETTLPSHLTGTAAPSTRPLTTAHGSAATAPKPPATKTDAPAPPAGGQDSSTTTSRLLALKKKRDTGKD